MEKKFEKLSDIDKVGYNLTKIVLVQNSINLRVTFGILLIAGILLILPSIIIERESIGVIILKIVGFLNVMVSIIFIFIGFFKSDKKEKEALEKFL